MNETIKTILERRSVRSFTGQEIPMDDLQLIVDAARYAPSGKNLQLCRFTVVKNKESITKLAAAIRDELGLDNHYNLFNPDCLILSATQRDSGHKIEDCACALENIFLAAHSLGIGSVWINQLKGICDAPNIRAVLDEFELPSDYLVFGMAALGYPAKPSQKVVKKENVKWIL